MIIDVRICVGVAGVYYYVVYASPCRVVVDVMCCIHLSVVT